MEHLLPNLRMEGCRDVGMGAFSCLRNQLLLLLAWQISLGEVFLLKIYKNISVLYGTRI